MGGRACTQLAFTLQPPRLLSFQLQSTSPPQISCHSQRKTCIEKTDYFPLKGSKPVSPKTRIPALSGLQSPHALLFSLLPGQCQEPQEQPHHLHESVLPWGSDSFLGCSQGTQGSAKGFSSTIPCKSDGLSDGFIFPE